MAAIDASNCKIDWSNEPDLDGLRRAYGMIETDVAQAITELTVLAERGSIMSMVYLADIFAAGKRAQKDEAAAVSWYTRAYARGSYIAMYNLGAIYYNSKRYQEAKEIFEAEACMNDTPSMYHLANIYLLQQGSAGDIDKALDLLERAAALGHIYAKKRLALLFISGRFGFWNIFRGFRIYARLPLEGCRMALQNPTSPLLNFGAELPPKSWAGASRDCDSTRGSKRQNERRTG